MKFTGRVNLTLPVFFVIIILEYYNKKRSVIMKIIIEDRVFIEDLERL
jgi:hypothetical protein